MKVWMNKRLNCYAVSLKITCKCLQNFFIKKRQNDSNWRKWIKELTSCGSSLACAGEALLSSDRCDEGNPVSSSSIIQNVLCCFLCLIRIILPANTGHWLSPSVTDLYPSHPCSSSAMLFQPFFFIMMKCLRVTVNNIICFGTSHFILLFFFLTVICFC